MEMLCFPCHFWSFFLPGFAGPPGPSLGLGVRPQRWQKETPDGLPRLLVTKPGMLTTRFTERMNDRKGVDVWSVSFTNMLKIWDTLSIVTAESSFLG